jgi:hypothetical protein
VSFFRQVLERLPDKQTGKNTCYEMIDAGLSAFSVFFTQTPVIVCSTMTQVLPLAPEFVQPQDEHDKQDCENAVAKRWLLQHGQEYQKLQVTILGDDLYCHQPLYEMFLQQSFRKY